MRQASTLLSTLVVAAALAGIAADAAALPRYAARYGQKCLLCHQSPGGGGMRSAYASQFLVPTEMAIAELPEEVLAGIDPQVGPNLSVGADARTLFNYSDADGLEGENNLFQMQADVYLNFQISPRYALYLDRGMSGTGEVYGIGFVLPASGYFRVGRFAPAYGWRFADHKAYVREDLGFAPPAHTDVGVELGFYPGDASLAFSALNGAQGRVRDDDDDLALAARAELRRGIGPANVALGGSVYRLAEGGDERLLVGPFGYFRLGPLTWLGELDWDRRDAAGAETQALVTTHELGWSLGKGVTLRGTYNFHDPDVDAATGSRSRFGLGVDLMPLPFLGVVAMVNRHEIDAGPAVTGEDRTQAELVLHFFY